MKDMEQFEQKRNLFALIGMTLSHVQLTESLINHTLLLVIQEGDGLDMEAFKKQNHLLNRKTLGQMVVILKKRVGLHEGLEELLTNFVQDRNTLAHNLGRVEGYDVATVQGRAAMTSFLRELIDNATRLQKIFLALGVSWQQQVGFVTPGDQDIREYLGEDYLNFSELLFHERVIQQ